jgi:hypothetical protein
MERYSYCGPVVSFGRCIQNNWKGETIAPSANKARNNLIYQWKKSNNHTPGTKISLPGEIKLIGEECV